MTTVSPAVTSLPAQPASSGSTAGPKPDSPDTFSSTLDREMASRSGRRAANSGTRPAHRTDPHAAHRPTALRGRPATPAGNAPTGDAAAGTAAAGTADGTNQAAGVPAAGGDATAVPGPEAMLAAAVALAQQQVKAQPTDPRVALAVPGSTVDASDADAHGSVDGSAPKSPAAGGPGAGWPTPAAVDAATAARQATADAGGSAGQVDGAPAAAAASGASAASPASATAGSATGTLPTGTLPTAAPPAGSDSPATATSIADALAADAAATSGTGTTTTPDGAGAGTGANAGSGSGSTGQQPGSDPAGLPSAAAGASAPDPTRSDPTTASAPVTPGTITAAEAGKVAETASIAATEALLNAAGAGAPLTMPDVTRASTDGAAARTAAALPSHVAELARLAHISSDGTARLTVRLDPPELGAVTLHMTSRGSDVELSLRAETPAGAAALAGQQARVRDLLADHGFDLSHFTIAGVTSGDDAGFGDARQRDQSGTSAGDQGSGESRFSTDPDRDDRGSARSGFAGGDGFGGGRSGSRTDDGWSENVSPARRSTAATTATEGTWL